MPKAATHSTSKPAPYPSSRPEGSTSGSGPSKAEYRFNFGKYRGRRVWEVPENYIDWCKKAGVTDNRLDLREAIQYEESLRAARARDLRHSLDERQARLKEVIPEWLYKECEALLTGDGYDDDSWMEESELLQEQARRIGILEDIPRTPGFLEAYPLRPPASATLPENSEPVKRLRELLKKCPFPDWSHFDDAGDDPYLSYSYDHFSGDHSAFFTKDYTDSLKQALQDIEKEHGTEARQVANWEVRDMEASRIGGVELQGFGKNFDEYDVWVDHSVHWQK